MKKNLFVFLFILSVIGVFSGILYQVKWLDYLFKPFIMISIAGHFLTHSKKIDKNLVKPAMLAFLFSLLGDSFLMFVEKGMIFFELGLASFLVAQISYIFLFKQSLKNSGAEPFLRKNLLYLIGYFLYGFIIYSMLFNALDIVLKIAVFVYMLALLGMSVMALNRFSTVNQRSFWLVYSGSILFVISDSLIAIDKFLSPIPNDRLWVMSTYIAAQYLITQGLLRQFE